MTKELSIKEQINDFLIYTTPNGKIKVEAIFNDENIWLSQKRIAELFGVDISTINEHLKNIYKTSELKEEQTIGIFPIVQKEGDKDVKREIKFYNLDAVLSVGYRVNSSEATQFRIWATEKLKEFVIKGFILDDERLKNGKYFGKDYFQELLERVRSIRASERRIYQKITDIFAECSTDYNENAPEKIIEKRDFFSMIQNKFHYAIKGQTAAEIIYKNADSQKPFMGLKTWKNGPEGRILKSDVHIAKNYLSEQEIKKLERTVNSFFDYVENLIENHKNFSMSEFAQSVDKFLTFNEYEILNDKGKISQKQAEKKADEEYEIFNKNQLIESDFDKFIKTLPAKESKNTPEN